MPRNKPALSTPHAKRPNGAGSYYPIAGNRKFKAAIHDVQGKLRTKIFYSEVQAQDWLIEQRRSRELGNATYALSPKDSVTVLLIKFLTNHSSNIKHGTHKSYKGSIARLHPYIGSINASKLTPRSVEDAYSQLKAHGYAVGTVKAAHRLLSVAYRDAVRLNEIQSNPMDKVRMPSGKSVSTKAIPSQDMAKIYQAAAHNSYALARIDIGFSLGIRPGEVFGLKWSDIDFKAKKIVIERQVQSIPGEGRVFQTVKQDDIRSLPLTEPQIAILLRHKAAQDLEKIFWKEDGDLVFPNSLGKKMDDRKDRARFRALCIAAGVPEYQVYQMRKTCFTNMAASGVGIKTVMEFSGHSQVSTLINSYVFPTDESMNAATKKMDDIRPIIDLDSRLNPHG